MTRQDNQDLTSQTSILAWLSKQAVSIKTQEYLSEVFILLGFSNLDGDYGNLIDTINQACIDAHELSLSPMKKWESLRQHLVDLQASLSKTAVKIPYRDRDHNGTSIQDIGGRPIIASLLADIVLEAREKIDPLRAVLISSILLDEKGTHRKKQEEMANELRLAGLEKGDDVPRWEILKEMPVLSSGLAGLALLDQRIKQLSSRTDFLPLQKGFLKRVGTVIKSVCAEWRVDQGEKDIEEHIFQKPVVDESGSTLGMLSCLFLSDSGGDIRDDVNEVISIDEPIDSRQTANGLIAKGNKVRAWMSLGVERLPWSSGALNIHEQRCVRDCIYQLARLRDKKANKTGLLIGLQLATAMPIEELLACEYGPDQKFTPEGEYIKKIAVPADAFKPEGELASLMAKHSDIIRLKLPKSVCQLLILCDSGSQRKPNEVYTVGELLEWNLNDAKEAVNEVLKELRSKGMRRIIRSRIENALRYSLASQTHDPLKVYLLAGREGEAPPIAVYYTAIQASALFEVYRDAVTPLLGSYT